MDSQPGCLGLKVRKMSMLSSFIEALVVKPLFGRREDELHINEFSVFH